MPFVHFCCSCNKTVVGAFHFCWQAFRPGMLDMPTGATEAAPAAIDAQGYGEFQLDFNMGGGDMGVFHE